MESNNQLIAPHMRTLRRDGSSLAMTPDVSESSSSLTWEQVIRVLRKYRWSLAVTIFGLTLATTVVAYLMRDIYQPVARVEIDPVAGGIRTLQEIDNTNSEGDLDYLDTQIQILQGDGLAMRVIRTLHLDRNKEFVSSKELKGAGVSTTTMQTRQQRPKDEGSFSQEQLELAQPTPVEAVALRSFHNKLSVNPIRGTRLVQVSFASHNPILSQSVANALVEQFIDQNYRNRYITTMGASEWLSSQLNDLRQRVSESNEAVADYQRKYGLVESDDRNVPMGELMTAISKQLSEAQADRIQSEAYVRMIDLGQQGSIPALRDDAVYQNLQTRYAEVRAQLAQAQTVYGEENSNVKKLQNEANEVMAQVEAERARLVSRLRTAFAAAQAREQMMTEARDNLRKKMGDESSHIVEYQTLKSEAIANSQLYNTLETRLREAGIYAGLRSGNIRIVDMAPRLHKPTGPHRGLIIGIGSILSAVIALTFVFIRESLDNTVRIPDDIREWLRLPCLGIVPKVNDRERAVERKLKPTVGTRKFGSGVPPLSLYPKLFWDKAQTAEAEAIRGLRTSFRTFSSAHGPQVVLVSSATAGEGKTTVAINLASVLAQQAKTCLIEGDLRCPMIEFAMGISTQIGLEDVLKGNATLTDAIVPSEAVAGLSVLPIKAIPDNPSDLLASAQMAAVVKSLREIFDYVVIDSPPLISFSDARSLALLSDGVILVSRYGITTRRSMTLSAEILTNMQLPVMGVVLNDMDLSSADFHYFNYGYSWRTAGAKSEYTKNQSPPLPPILPGDTPAPRKAKGAHT